MPHQKKIVPDRSSLSEMFKKCADVVIHDYSVTTEADAIPVTLIYCDGLTDIKTVNEIVLPRLKETDLSITEDLSSRLALTLVEQGEEADTDTIVDSVFSGQLLISIGEFPHSKLYTLDIANLPGRPPEESALETSEKGARDGFTEELNINIGLVRKRLRTKSFCYEQFVKGGRTHTKIALLYMDDVINPEILELVRSRLDTIDVDGVIGSSFIERTVMGSIPSIFPLFDMTQRPDYVVNSIMNGRFAVMFEGSPLAIIAPTTLFNQLKSPEDENTPFFMVTLERLLRVSGLVISSLFPGFYIGLTSFNVEQIPLPLLATVAGTRLGLPMPVPLEAFMMIFMFELFNEAGRRLPRALGQTVTVVGGLIIGDAAIRAGITSPTIIVAVAISVISSYILVNSVLSSITSLVRLAVLFFSSILGLYGFFICTFILIVHLASLESYGVRYLSPISPLNPKDFLHAITMMPSLGRKKRPDVLQTQDDTRKGGAT